MAVESVLILSSDTNLLLVPVDKSYAVTTIFVNNYSSSTSSSNDSSFDMHVVKNLQTKSNANKVINNMSMPAQETFVLNMERLVLGAGDRIVLTSPDSDKLSATVSYLEV